MNLTFRTQADSPGLLVLCGTNPEFNSLASRFLTLSPEDQIRIDQLPGMFCEPSLKLTVQLSGRDRIMEQSEFEFTWHLDSEAALEVTEKITTLGASKSGHQYFDCHPADVSIVMSVGEYDREAGVMR